MFYKCENGRLQNLFYLQNVIVVESDTENKYSVGWVQSNGTIIKEYDFNTEEEAKAKVETIINILLQ